MAETALQLLGVVPISILGYLRAGVWPRCGSSLSPDSVNCFLFLRSELDLRIRYCSHSDGFCSLAFLLDDLQVQGSLIGGLERGIIVLHELFPDLVLETGNEELGLEVVSHGSVCGNPIFLVFIGSSHCLLHVVGFG